MSSGGRGMRTFVRARGRNESARSRLRLRRRGTLVAALVLLVSALSASQAFAVFPLLGKGTLSEPSTWKFAPGETLSNIGGRVFDHFGAVPATPPSEPIEKLEVEKLNGQEDELCGVKGMSITDGNATMPSGTGSCIAAGTKLHTALQVTLGRPDVRIAELD